MVPPLRPSYDALPTWLARLPEVPPTPVRAYRPRDEGVLGRALRSSRLPMHVGLLAVALGLAAAVAAGSVRASHTAEARAEMTAFATRKAAELRAFDALRVMRPSAPNSPLAPGGSLTDNVVGYSDVVEGTGARLYRRRWAVEANRVGQRRVLVRVIPEARGPVRAGIDLTTVFALH